MESRLVRLCIEAATKNRETVEKWRLQRRSLERLPSQLSDALLHRLLHRRLLSPSLLEVFKHTVEKIDLRGESTVDAEWMAYIGAFKYLHSLNVAGCHGISSSALWPITAMSSLREIDFSRCAKVTDAGIKHLLSMVDLEKLWIPETGVTANGVKLISSLSNLSVLDLGGLPVTDLALSSLQALTKLQYLDLWGSKISNKGAAVLKMFPKLTFLNVGWTNVTVLPNLPSLECLNMSNCTVNSIFEANGKVEKSHLAKLILSGATFTNELDAFSYIETSSLVFLDVSNTSLQSFSFMAKFKALEHLDLGSSTIGDESLEVVAGIGEHLKTLILSNTKVTSSGLGILVGHVSNLEVLSLAHTWIDDMVMPYINMIPSIKVLDLSNTNVKGLIHQAGADPDSVPSLALLHNLHGLEKLNLEQTRTRDAALSPLSRFQKLSHLSLRSASLTDESLYLLSSFPKLTYLSVRDSVLTNYGLSSFKPPPILTTLDLRGCWLLTEDQLLEFSITHPQIEVRHELIHISPSDENNINHLSPSRKSPKTSQTVSKQAKDPIPISPAFVDQRLKYGRDELLALQYSSSSREGVSAMPQQME